MTHSNSTQQTAGNYNVRNGLVYFLIGGGIGAAAALLLAPKSGPELRHDISEAAHKGYDETMEFAHRFRERYDDLYTTLREKADHAFEFATGKLSLVEDGIDETVDKAEYVLGNGELDSSQKRSRRNAGRRPASIF